MMLLNHSYCPAPCCYTVQECDARNGQLIIKCRVNKKRTLFKISLIVSGCIRGALLNNCINFFFCKMLAVMFA